MYCIEVKMDCTVHYIWYTLQNQCTQNCLFLFFCLIWEPSSQWAIPRGNNLFILWNKMSNWKSKCYWEAKTQWCKCEPFLNLGLTNGINCNISGSLLEIWAVRGNECLLSRTGHVNRAQRMVQTGRRSSGMSVWVWCLSGWTDLWPTGARLTQVPFKPRSGG